MDIVVTRFAYRCSKRAKMVIKKAKKAQKNLCPQLHFAYSALEFSRPRPILEHRTPISEPPTCRLFHILIVFLFHIPSPITFNP